MIPINFVVGINISMIGIILFSD